MKVTARISIVALVLLVLGSYASAQQDEFTFIADNGVWGLGANWAGGPPGLFPGAGDKAIIPANKICNVQGANRAAEIVQVDVGGTLIIKESRTLTLDTDGNGTNDTPKLTVNGQVRFEGTDATLVYGNALSGPYFVLDGAGTVLADGAAGP